MNDNTVTITVKFTVKNNRLNEFFKALTKLETDAFDLYWLEGINWPVKVEERLVSDPIKNVTGY